MRCCLASDRAAMVRMLWRRSASLISRTLMSLAMATSILRMVAACCASLESKRTRSSLVTPPATGATAACARRCSPSVVRHERHHVAAGQTVAPVQERELDHEAEAQDVGSQLLDQAGRSRRRAARGQHVVDDQHLLAGMYGV